MALKVTGTTVVDDNKIFLPNNASSVRTAPTISAGVLTIDLNSGTLFDVSLNANITSIVISNIQTSGRTSSFILRFTADGTARSVTWPASFAWPSQTAPTLSSAISTKDIFAFLTTDGGTIWDAVITGQNF